jgi:hypothetical protein
MATLKPEGIWNCTVISAKAGVIDGKPLAQITVQITDGPATGTRCTYQDDLIGKSALYTRRSMEAVGWAGATARTFADDVTAWIARTGGASTVEIKHHLIKNGKRAGETWDKVNSVGRGGARPMADLSGDLLADVDQAMREAAALDGASRPADDEAPPF